MDAEAFKPILENSQWYFFDGDKRDGPYESQAKANSAAQRTVIAILKRECERLLFAYDPRVIETCKRITSDLLGSYQVRYWNVSEGQWRKLQEWLVVKTVSLYGNHRPPPRPDFYSKHELLFRDIMDAVDWTAAFDALLSNTNRLLTTLRNMLKDPHQRIGEWESRRWAMRCLHPTGKRLKSIVPADLLLPRGTPQELNDYLQMTSSTAAYILTYIFESFYLVDVCTLEGVMLQFQNFITKESIEDKIKEDITEYIGVCANLIKLARKCARSKGSRQPIMCGLSAEDIVMHCFGFTPPRSILTNNLEKLLSRLKPQAPRNQNKSPKHVKINPGPRCIENAPIKDGRRWVRDYANVDAWVSSARGETRSPRGNAAFGRHQ